MTEERDPLQQLADDVIELAAGRDITIVGLAIFAATDEDPREGSVSIQAQSGTRLPDHAYAQLLRQAADDAEASDWDSLVPMSQA